MEAARSRLTPSKPGLALGLLVLLACAGCRALPSREQVLDGGQQPLDVAGRTALSAELEASWSRRDEGASLARALEGYPRLVASEDRPEQRAALCVRLARGHAFFARAHAEDDGAREAHWQAGAAWADRALSESPVVQAAEARGDDLLDVLPELGADEAEALYWHAINLASWSSAAGLAAVMASRERFLACMRRVEAFDPEGFAGGVQRFLAADYAAAPALAGGDMDEARARFQWALEIEPRRFENHVMFAERWAIPEGELGLARTLLRAVVEGDATALPESAPEQRVEQRRAAELLASLDG